MTTSSLKKMLEDYRYDNQYYLAKVKHLKEQQMHIKNAIARCNELNVANNNTQELLQYQIEEEKALTQLLDKKLKTEKIINNAGQPFSTLFYLKYINFLNFDEVADEMNFSTKRIYQLHKQGLERIINSYNQEN